MLFYVYALCFYCGVPGFAVVERVAVLFIVVCLFVIAFTYLIICI